MVGSAAFNSWISSFNQAGLSASVEAGKLAEVADALAPELQAIKAILNPKARA
ncbi:hypothetical protein GCM10028895_34320 [Pontibacter rugosus]